MEYAGYTWLKYGSYNLLYTKEFADQRPIAATSVGNKPCLLENDARKEKCDKYDDRFQ